ncbi:ski-like protein [Bufo gargarizans]|uniref:ski-like protein n=1 Tax=Bufo gargarizans TaxID=30331 RepID=UPI001CF2AB10|nr:ski-like protein [Bufo gargarizans]XP_044145794.1 ski-like protein [Bufo gargarizans]XP_044145796.1 ski-like protein [Bufo gargarizans]
MGEDGSPPLKKLAKESDVIVDVPNVANKVMAIKMEIDDFKEPTTEDNKDCVTNSTSVPLGGSSKLNPGLKHTLAQFNLSSRSSLGGPAAFSARFSQENMSPTVFLPLPSPQIHPGPLLIPSDSSTELTQTELEGESISCFMVGGEKRLCLPQVLNSVLRDFSLQQINIVCDEMYIYCSRCTSDQLHILKVLGILPFNAPSCGLITLTDAQRLCNALLRPHTYPQNGSLLPAKNSLAQLKETGSAFEVEHDCLGKCQGLFAPQLYTQPDAPCIQCLECYGMFSTQTFVMHSHRSPDKRTCHWGFDSSKWHCYLHLSPKLLSTPEGKKTKVVLEEMKEKFTKKNQPKRIQPKTEHIQTLELPSWYPVIKQEDDGTNRPHLLHPSYYLYMYDKVVAPNVSLSAGVSQCKDSKPLRRDTETNKQSVAESENQARSTKHKSATSYPDLSMEEQESVDLKTDTQSSNRQQTSSNDGEKDNPVCKKEDVCEDDKGHIMEEVVKTFLKQQEKLNYILQKKHQIQMEVEMLSSSKAVKELTMEQQNLQKEFECLQTEHLQKMEELYDEQRDLEEKLKQVKKQKCSCDSNAERDKEAQYANQLTELRQRLDQAEADRRELQDELRREREAREKLELLIKELKLQILKSAKNGNGD